MKNKKFIVKGFTLIEIMLVIALVLTVGFFSTAFPLRLMSQTAVRDSAEEFKNVLWKAQAYAIAGRQHSSWGVHYGNSVVTLFKGNDYNNREQSFDEKTTIADRVSVSGFSDTIFSIPGGRPQSAIADVILTRDNLMDSFSLNSEGLIE